MEMATKNADDSIRINGQSPADAAQARRSQRLGMLMGGIGLGTGAIALLLSIIALAIATKVC